MKVCVCVSDPFPYSRLNHSSLTRYGHPYALIYVCWQMLIVIDEINVFRKIDFKLGSFIHLTVNFDPAAHGLCLNLCQMQSHAFAWKVGVKLLI